MNKVESIGVLYRVLNKNIILTILSPIFQKMLIITLDYRQFRFQIVNGI